VHGIDPDVKTGRILGLGIGVPLPLFSRPAQLLEEHTVERCRQIFKVADPDDLLCPPNSSRPIPRSGLDRCAAAQ
jgi:hypothetical protein